MNSRTEAGGWKGEQKLTLDKATAKPLVLAAGEPLIHPKSSSSLHRPSLVPSRKGRPGGTRVLLLGRTRASSGGSPGQGEDNGIVGRPVSSPDCMERALKLGRGATTDEGDLEMAYHSGPTVATTAQFGGTV